MKSNEIESILTALDSKNACLLYMNQNDTMHHLIKGFREQQEIPSMVLTIHCEKAVNYLDMATFMYKDFAEELVKILKNVSSISDYLYRMENLITNNVRQPIVEVEDVEAEDAEGEYSVFEMVLREIIGIMEKENIKLLLIFKEIEYLMDYKRFTKYQFWRLRGFLQGNKIYDLIATTKSKQALQHDSKSPFFKFFKLFIIADEKGSMYLSLSLNRENIFLDNVLVEYIAKKLDYNNQQIKMFICTVKRNLDTNEQKRIEPDLSEKDIAEFLSIYIEENILYYKRMLYEIRGIKHGLYVFKRIILKNDEANNMLLLSMLDVIEREKRFSSQDYNRVARRLVKEGFLVRIGQGKYIPCVSLFADYIVAKDSQENIWLDIKNKIRERNG